MNLKAIHSAYFVGIGGIGMSAIARFLHLQGIAVSGYDRVRSKRCQALEQEGISVHYSDDPDLIPRSFCEASKDAVLVVYTPAVPASHRGLSWLRERGYTVHKRSVVLGMIAADFKTVAVAGTHGKTTTSAMVAHILTECGLGCNAFLGGISANYNSNLIVDSSSPYAVVEADEFDRSFLALHPQWAVVTSVESDHLDIYGEASSLTAAFDVFVQQVDPDGVVYYHAKLDNLHPQAMRVSYAVEEPADLRAENVRVESGAFHFDLAMGERAITGIRLGMPGRHNVENALAAAGIALTLDVEEPAIRKALGTFKGVKRRFEMHINTNKVVYIDDYAHHPTEITACIGAARELFPQRRITGVFQPHLFSRTRDLADGFADALSALDEVILMEIYPAREDPIEGVSAQMILDRVSAKNKALLSGEALLGHVEKAPPEVLITMGAGDIDQWVEPIKNTLSQ